MHINVCRVVYVYTVKKANNIEKKINSSLKALYP